MLFPNSPSSSISSFSDLSTSPPKLDPSTLALLDSFYMTKANEERRFKELAAERAAAEVAGLALEDTKEEKPMMSVEEYQLAFGEDWQLSQFWYKADFAYKLARHLHSLCAPETKIAFLCCPTAFVAFQHQNPHTGARLLEVDQRFAVLSPKAYFPYDMDEPDIIPEDLKGKVDIAIVDPPFLNEDTNTKLSTTLKLLLHPTKGKLVLLTSVSIEDILRRIYASPPIGPLRRTTLEVEHNRLANDFACWGTWDGAEDFGASEPASSQAQTAKN
ncbi:hypothetical protein AX16_009910 [Volvariella volvacea WC 439]|nr:hypothetical protein AX16_009910 [Volvariella volvacea WC 439]